MRIRHNLWAISRFLQSTYWRDHRLTERRRVRSRYHWLELAEKSWLLSDLDTLRLCKYSTRWKHSWSKWWSPFNVDCWWRIEHSKMERKSHGCNARWVCKTHLLRDGPRRFLSDSYQHCLPSCWCAIRIGRSKVRWKHCNRPHRGMASKWHRARGLNRMRSSYMPTVHWVWFGERCDENRWSLNIIWKFSWNVHVQSVDIINH